MTKAGHAAFRRALALSALAVAAVFVILELSLRLAGYSGPQGDAYESLVLKRPLFVEDRGALVTNPERSRNFHTQLFRAGKAPGVKRIFVFGGSVPYGYRLRAPAGESFPAVLAGLLGVAEVINAGGKSYATGRLLPLVKECLDYGPDLVVVMSGHNEFLEARHYGALRGKEKVGFLEDLRVTRLLWEAVARARYAARSLGGRGLSMADKEVEERYIVRDAEEVRRTVDNFRSNLESIIALCEARGVPVIIGNEPSNLRDWPPFVTNFGAADRRALSDELKRGERELEAGRPAAALEMARKALAADGGLAAFHYLAGKSLDALGRSGEARGHYVLARDLDGFPHRASSAMNEAAKAAALGGKAVFFDAEELFMKASPGGIPGKNLFIDQCHPTAEGHRLLARGLADISKPVLGIK